MNPDQISESSQSSTFETIKKISQDGIEFWSARDLMVALGYATWRNFKDTVIRRAMDACRQSGAEVVNHFADTNKVVDAGSNAKMTVEDYFISRFGGYLIAMNGDPNKPEIAQAQVYFVVQTRRQEVADQSSTYDEQRIDTRLHLTESTKSLNSAAKEVGVTRFGIFADEGYKGLYGGMGAKEVSRHKKVPPNEHLFDRIGHAELAAHDFRATQAKERLEREKGSITGEQSAFRIHKQVGEAVRNTIREQGNTMPEDLPIEPNIKPLIQRRQRTAKLLHPPRSD